MNPHLKNIISLLEEDAAISPEKKAVILLALQKAGKEFDKTSFKLDRTEKIKRTTSILLEETIEELEQKQKAVEAQKKELEVESSLEKVRTAAMSMKKRADMILVCRIIMEQLAFLKVDGIRNVQTAVFNEERRTYVNYEYYSHPQKEVVTEIPYDLHPVQKEFAIRMLSGPGEVYEHGFKEEEIQAWIRNQVRTGEYIDPNLYAAQSLDYYWYSLGPVAMGISSYRPLNAGEITLFIRFKNVFELAYRRYLDIEKAEMQARETQIELALERVRARTMAMQRSDELPEAANNLFLQVQSLGIPAWSAGYCIWEGDKKATQCFMSSEGVIQKGFMFPAIGEGYNFYDPWQNGESFHVRELGGEDLVRHYEFMRRIPVVGELLDSINAAGFPLPTYQVFHVAYFSYGFLMFITYEHVPDFHPVFRRFSNVFDQTYTRFLDLRKAEAQTREAQIEVAVERVRASALAMHRSEEIMNVVVNLRNELISLNIPGVTAATIYLEHGEGAIRLWDLTGLTESENGYLLKMDIVISLEEADPDLWFQKIWKSQEKYFVVEQDKKDLERTLIWLRQHDPEAAESITREMEENNIDHGWHPTVQLEKGRLSVDLILPPPVEIENILVKMGAAFDLAYRRFLDLQKAEAQAKEARIETSLERVRSSAMAMHSSDDLANTVDRFFVELNSLNVLPRRCGVTLINKETRVADLTFTTATEHNTRKKLVGKLKLAGHPVLEGVYENWVLQKEFRPVLRGNEIREYYSVMNPQVTMPDFGDDDVQYGYYFYFREGGVYAWSDKEFGEEELSIFRKFTSVLSLTYRRFLDLVEAESQAREAKIEAALEKVRGRAMAMQKSEELQDLILIVYAELTKLDLVLDRCFIIIFDPVTFGCTWWMAAPETSVGIRGLSMNYHSAAPYRAHVEAWESREVRWQYILGGAEKKQWDEYLFSQTEFVLLPEIIKENMQAQQQVYLNASFNAFGCLSLATVQPLTEEQFSILIRFANVFDLSYTRFNDLKLAEEQAREARIEASLERVRSKAMAMHSSKDLAETIVAFYHELEFFSITPRRCGVGLLNKGTRVAELSTMNTTEQGKSVEIIGRISMTGHPVLDGVYENWLKQQEYHPVLRGPEIAEYYKLVRPQVNFPDYPNDTVQYGYFFFFPEGGVYAWTEKEMAEEELKLYRRFTSVLSLTYKRYKDLQQAEALAVQAEQDLVLLKEEKHRTEEALRELKAAQAQLIHSEKMASLGELTAGIAHEIQNPLNFVNNFSEVSNELIDEMVQAVEKGEFDEVKVIAADVKQNLEKITHHGKRADGIVKGMLQHSRSSTGQKEWTDINVLADEYLRLSYHGLRAKDKTFNAKFVTEFDENMGKVNIVSQELGRVVLNLINNAFYAVYEKKKLRQPEYDPIVTVSTKRINDKAEIKVQDNGTGIPKRVLDKIFQPFFTTKPTGQGTGLGLSLSYDIIRAHGGELRVETKEGEGTIFTIELSAL
jgi:signal transduction histidine kinase